MGRVKKYADAKTRTVFVRDTLWQKARQIVHEKFGKSISDYLNEHFEQLISKYDGQGDPAQQAVNYENMKRQYSRIVEEVKLLTSRLKKEGVYEDLMGLAYSLGLDLKDLHNVSAIVPQLFQKWDGYSEHLHLFISLLEIGQKKKALERELTELRKQMYFSHEGSEVDEADASTHTVQGPRGLSQVRANGAPESP